jgi:hypothetical protein
VQSCKKISFECKQLIMLAQDVEWIQSYKIHALQILEHSQFIVDTIQINRGSGG